MTTNIEIQGLTFLADGLVVQYLDTATDVRVKGAVVHQHQVTLSAGHPDYREDIERLHSRAVKVLNNALEDFEESEPYLNSPDAPDDDETEMGMGGAQMGGTHG